MQPGESYKVRVDGIQFAAGHFATFRGGCEPLHGHNYQVAAEVDGALAADSWVFDFVELKTILRGICKGLDHRFLLQRDSRLLDIQQCGDAWQIRTPAGDEYSLPVKDVVALPIDNTTAERLAEWFCGRLGAAITELGAMNVTTISVEVSEGPGQSAGHRRAGLPVG